MMENVQDLFNFILHHERTLVFGNMGRYPKVIYEAVESIPLIQVRIISHIYPVLVNDPRIRVIDNCDSVDHCDLLIYIEPPSLKIVKKHPLASHVVVFTSHFTFQTYINDWWQHVCYFHAVSLEDVIEKTSKLLKLQNPSLQTNDPGLIDANFQNIIISSQKDGAPPPNTYFIVDLTTFKRDTLSMYLNFWDNFDYMLEHFESIGGWVICYSSYNGRRAFDRFTQKCIDFLVCRQFEHGNITKLPKILSLIPFYKSGIIDKNFEVATSEFGGMKIVIPQTIQDACKASVQYDLEHLTKHVYYIRE